MELEKELERIMPGAMRLGPRRKPRHQRLRYWRIVRSMMIMTMNEKSSRGFRGWLAEGMPPSVKIFQVYMYTHTHNKWVAGRGNATKCYKGRRTAKGNVTCVLSKME
jgi:hypothetical protein